MENNNAWLRAEIAQWLREGLITDQQAERLYARYPMVVDRSRQRGEHHGWGKMIFSALGVMVFGLGIILLFAYNWEAMHRYGKLASIGLGLLLSHGAALYLSRTGSLSRIAESLHLLGTMLFGAGVWLVAQIYHMNAHFPDAFLLWALAALVMAWVLPSAAQGVLAALLLVLWSGLEVFEFEQFHQWGMWLIALGILPLAWWQRAPALLLVGLLLLPLSYMFTVVHLDSSLVVASLCYLAVAYLGVARLSVTQTFAESRSIFYRCGLLIFLPMLFAASFIDVYRESMLVPLQSGYHIAYFLLPLALALASWAAAIILPASRPVTVEAWVEAGLILLPCLLMLMLSFGVELYLLSCVVANLAFLGFAVLLILRGTEQVRWTLTTLGCSLLAVLVFARFSDLFESLLTRAAVFLLLGGLMFLVGLRYSRQSERKKIAGAPHA